MLLFAALALHLLAPQTAPTLSLAPRSGASPAAVEVAALDRATLQRLTAATQEELSRILTIHVAGAGPQAPAVTGAYSVASDKLRFVPRYPLEPGLRYRAVLRLPDRTPIERELLLPAAPRAATTALEAVYPTSEHVPENLLKLYLHFSAPMRRGEVYRRVHLLDAAGRAVDLPFLEIEQELWGADGRRLTLLFDPGRIKRGLRPREESGPILEEGKSYVLVVDRDWPDAEGNVLTAGYRKTLRAGPPAQSQPDPASWKIVPPRPRTLEPLTITFPEPLDHALLGRVIAVLGPPGQRVPGAVSIEAQETRWRFTPAVAWSPGAYQLEVDTTLEDLAGNSIGRPFEVDAVHPIERRATLRTVRIPFAIR